jgi:outer membrane protein
MVRLGLFLVACAALLPAQSKVAVINSQQAVVATAEIQKAQAELEAKFKPRQEEMTKLQNEIASLQSQIQQGQGKLTPQALQDLQIRGQRAQRDLQRLNEDTQSEVDRQRNEVLTRAAGRMQEIVGKLAAAKDFDVVIDTSNTIYFKPALDLTKEATAAYDKAHPVQ